MLTAPGFSSRSCQYAAKRWDNRIWQHHIVGIDVLKLEQNRIPRQWPGRHRTAYRTKVRENLDIMTQHDITGLCLRRRMHGWHKKQARNDDKQWYANRGHRRIVTRITLCYKGRLLLDHQNASKR